MAENGGGKTSIIGEALGLLDDQIELAALELEYESGQGMRRLLALGVACLFFIAAFILLQVSLVFGLAALGLSVAQACLLLAGVYGIAGAGLLAKWGRRDPQVGEPFQSTREELRKNIQWIRQFFS